MRISGRYRHWLWRQIAGCLALVLVATLVSAAPFPQQATNTAQEGASAASARSQSQEPENGDQKLTAKPALLETKPALLETTTDNLAANGLPDSPGSVRLRGVDQNVGQNVDQNQDNNQPSGGQPPSSQPQQTATQEPAGTAAAPSVKVTGVAASQPAGAAIAPGKQKRARSILIKVGVILGAAVAVGTVVALSSASPSRPSH
jgi:hypothetical protein